MWPGSKLARFADGDGYVINGSKTFIINDHRADMIVLVTKTDPEAGYVGFTLQTTMKRVKVECGGS